MNYEDRFLAFIDILGFTDTVDDTIRCNDCKNYEKCMDCKKIGKYTTLKKKEISFKIDTIDNLLDEIRYQLTKDKFLPIKKIETKNRVVSQISDSIVISYLKENAVHNILQDIYFLCIMALEKGFLFRGAVVCGKVIHTDNKLFGPAFLRAYEMEKNTAQFPRIIIDDEVLNIAKENYSNCTNPDSEYNDLLKLIPCDFDGKRYINYIDKLYTGVNVGENGEQEHRLWVYEAIKKLEEKINVDDSLKCKYLWLKEKFEKSRANL